MITKKQWNRFVWDVEEMYRRGFGPSIYADRVVKVDRVDNVIYTEVGSDTRGKYTYSESIGPNVDLRLLYNRVILRSVPLGEVKKEVLS